jgi:hypothetical protein
MLNEVCSQAYYFDGSLSSVPCHLAQHTKGGVVAAKVEVGHEPSEVPLGAQDKEGFYSLPQHGGMCPPNHHQRHFWAGRRRYLKILSRKPLPSLGRLLLNIHRRKESMSGTWKCVSKELS